MATFARQIHRIAQFVRWNDRDQLVLQPKFQRRPSWEPAARSYLIDTIVRELPMPKVYLRKIVNPKTDLSAYEVVDGQQRLRAILDFHAGSLALNPKHSPELGGCTFATLPDAARRAFLDYEIPVELIQKASDREVWDMFERLNTYTLTLNRQERLNAKHFGYFKQTAYKLAAEDSALSAWRRMRVFGNRQIARMREVELTSDVLVAIVGGISDITHIANAYGEYDDEFPKRDEAMQLFRRSLAWIVSELPDTVRSTRFRNLAWFYSLLVATVDVLAGIPKGLGPKPLCHTSHIRSRMSELDMTLKTTELTRLPQALADLHAALSRATSHIPQRQVRHSFFVDLLTLPERGWRELCNGITTGGQGQLDQ